MAKLKITSGLAPKGEFLFCAVVGQGIKNEDKSTRKGDVYEYKVKLEVGEDDAADFMDAVDELIEGELAKGDEIVKLPYQTHEDYDGIPKGMVWIEAKCGTEFEGADGELVDVNVGVYDSTGKKCNLPDGVGVGKGSTGKVFGTIGTWDNKDGIGASLWLTSIQIADFKPYTFEEAPEEMEGGFKGFDSDKSDLEKSEVVEDEEKPTRRSRRSKSEDTEEPTRRSRRSRR